MKRLLGSAFVVGALFATGCAAEVDGDPDESTESAVSSAPSCTDASATTKCQLSVLTLSVDSKEDDWKHRKPRLLAELTRLKPDVIALQHVNLTDDQCQTIQDGITGAHYERIQRENGGFNVHYDEDNLCILSRFKQDKDKTDFEQWGNKRLILRSSLELPKGNRVNVYSTHLWGDLKESERVAQAKEAAKFIRKGPGAAATILAGDLSSSPTSPPVRHLVGDQGFTDSYQKTHGPKMNPGFTYPVSTKGVAEPTLRADYVLSKGAIRTLSSEVVLTAPATSKGGYMSDHFGVLSKFEVTLQ